MTTATIRVIPGSPRDTRLWALTRQVAEVLTGVPWVLVGGQMVAIPRSRERRPASFHDW